MSPRPGVAAPDRPRRSQAERTAETRGRIIAAVVESIADVGYQRTTATEIAGRAGVTWGAVQHHFGGKDGILVAVLEDSFARFAGRLADIDARGVPLAERVDLFLDRAWEHFASDHYRSTFEILLNHAGQERAASEPAWQDAMFEAWGGVWDRLFGDAGLPRRRAVELQRYTLAALAGIASLRMLRPDDAPLGGPELALLKQTLVRELQRRADR